MKKDSKKEKKKNGRPEYPTKMTDVVRKRILDSLERGLSVDDSSTMAGLGTKTVQRWIDKGKEPDAPQIYIDFHNDVQMAKMRIKNRAISTISNNLENSQVAFKWLSIRHPDEWSESRNWNIKADINTKISGSLDIKFRELIDENPEIKAKWIEKLKKEQEAQEASHDSDVQMYD